MGAPAVDGRATEAVRRALADALGVRPGDVALRLGATSRDKVFTVTVAGDEILARLAALRDGVGVSGGLDLALLIGAAVLLVAVAAVRLSTRLGLPSLLVYLAIGMLIGEAGLGIRFDDAELTRTLGFCALVVIIAEGGLTARWSALRPVLGLAARWPRSASR